MCFCWQYQEGSNAPENTSFCSYRTSSQPICTLCKFFYMLVLDKVLVLGIHTSTWACLLTKGQAAPDHVPMYSKLLVCHRLEVPRILMKPQPACSGHGILNLDRRMCIYLGWKFPGSFIRVERFRVVGDERAGVHRWICIVVCIVTMILLNFVAIDESLTYNEPWRGRAGVFCSDLVVNISCLLY